MRASPWFSLWQVEGAEGLAKRTQAKSPNHSSSLQTIRVIRSLLNTSLHGSHRPPGKTP